MNYPRNLLSQFRTILDLKISRYQSQSSIRLCLMFMQYIQLNYLYDGYVYVLSNKTMPNIYKIGYMISLLQTRATKLYTTGIPSRFPVEKSYECHNCKLFEQWMHKLFRNHRINTDKEFFSDTSPGNYSCRGSVRNHYD